MLLRFVRNRWNRVGMAAGDRSHIARRALTTVSKPSATPGAAAATAAAAATESAATSLSPSAVRRQQLNQRQLENEQLQSQAMAVARANAGKVWEPEYPPEATPRQIENFKIFNRNNGKFRVAVINQCNMNCFFCHNEGMWNPRQTGQLASLKRKGPATMSTDDMLNMMNAFTRMGGTQINITGGEPLSHPDIVHILNSIDKRNTRIVLNSNVLNATRLLDGPFVPNLTSIFASLHTTSNEMFQKQLMGGAQLTTGASQVMANMVALKQKGYDVQINYSLGEYNRHEFARVLDFAIANHIHIKVIALIRPHDKPGFYNGQWIDPHFLDTAIAEHDCVEVQQKTGFGGATKVYRVRNAPPNGSIIQVKNIATGRLVTDFCRGCQYHSKQLCGEGIYALRAGVDGIFKPCLLRTEKFSAIDTGRNATATDDTTAPPAPVIAAPPTPVLSGINRDPARTPHVSYDMQILRGIDAMVGDWKNAYYNTGAPV